MTTHENNVVADRHSATVAIIGGSVGGLATALELGRIGVDGLAVYERSAGQMQARGAGVVMQPEVELLLNRIGVSAAEVSVRLDERVGLERDGAMQTFAAPQLMTAWDTLYRRLRAPLDDVCTRIDSRLVALSDIVESGGVVADFADGYQVEADLVVGADGVGSGVRTAVLGEGAASTYAGYVAWRGLEDESSLPEDLVADLAGRFTSFQRDGMQMLCYLVPGADGSNESGRRRVNWVWYVNAPEPGLARLMTSESGRRYSSFLPPGEASDAVTEQVLSLSEATLPPIFVRLVAASMLFCQPVEDVAPVGRVHGRVVLAGDAAGTVRPHTASGTSKAFGDAMVLSEALEGWAGGPLPTDRLEAWDRQRDDMLRRIASGGIDLARRSGLGPQSQAQPLAI